MTPSGPSSKVASAGGKDRDGRRSRTHAKRTGAAAGGTRLDEIVAAASRLFVEKGYEQTSIQDIAEAVGVLKGSLYYYIAAKEDLLYWAVLRNHANLYESVIGSRKHDQVPPLDRIRDFIDRHVDFVLNNKDSSVLYAHEFAVLSEERQAEVLVLRRRYEDYFVKLIQDVQKSSGSRSFDDPVILARALLSMCNALSQWHREGGRFEQGLIRKHYIEISTRAVAP